jgi:soluble lytic murein transglycosylase-like protein
MQISPRTGRLMGCSRADLFDADKNRACGKKYLDTLLETFGGDITKALAGYNCGPARWKRCRGYARKVLRKVENANSIASEF